MSMPIHGLVISNARPFMLPVNQLTIFLRCNSVLKRRELEMALQEQVPIIDMEGIDGLRRSEIIEAIRNASEIWGFFQVVNHGIPGKVMEEVMNGVAEFHRHEDDHVKLGLTSCDIMKKVQFQRNVKHVSTHEKLVWKDTLKLDMAPDPPLPNEIPSSCREVMFVYTKHVSELARALLEVISEGLGLGTHHLTNLGCADGMRLFAHYYHATCTNPKMAATTQHTDPSFLTILLQDQVGGLQILQENHWINVHPIHGSLVVNIGDLLQLITNDRIKSVIHRVVRNNVHARQSVACIMGNYKSKTVYGPIKELINDNAGALYRGTTAGEYLIHFLTKVVDLTAALNDFKL